MKQFIYKNKSMKQRWMNKQVHKDFLYTYWYAISRKLKISEAKKYIV